LQWGFISTPEHVPGLLSSQFFVASCSSYFAGHQWVEQIRCIGANKKDDLPHRHQRLNVKQNDLSIAKVGKIGHTPKENGEKF
jgi:hypothetical protein